MKANRVFLALVLLSSITILRCSGSLENSEMVAIQLGFNTGQGEVARQAVRGITTVNYRATQLTLSCDGGYTKPLTADPSGKFWAPTGRTGCLVSLNQFASGTNDSFTPIGACSLGAVGTACPFQSQGLTLFVSVLQQLPPEKLKADGSYSVSYDVQAAGSYSGGALSSISLAGIEVRITESGAKPPQLGLYAVNFDPGLGQDRLFIVVPPSASPAFHLTAVDTVTGQVIFDNHFPVGALQASVDAAAIMTAGDSRSLAEIENNQIRVMIVEEENGVTYATSTFDVEAPGPATALYCEAVYCGNALYPNAFCAYHGCARGCGGSECRANF